ncbi:MAG: ATP-dependent helicase HrpB [Pseudomonadota bacterium]
MLSSLPINAVLGELSDALAHHNRAILQAPPGAGKTTAVPLALLDADWLQGQKIIVLEPRRLAARRAAERMAELLGEGVGETVGYRIRLERKVSQQTRIEVVTEGVLTRMIQDDPALTGVGAVLFDEFHERNLQADLALAFSLQSQTLLREDLRLLIMSATLDGEGIQQLLDGVDDSHTPLITSEGRSFEVDTRYLDTPAPRPADRRAWLGGLARLVLDALAEEPGSALVFAPGQGEIQKLAEQLKAQLDDPNTIIAPLYGALSKAEQDRAIAPAPRGQRKVVLATNIAETSLTIEGIRIVVDGGLQRRSRFDPNTGMSGLVTEPIASDAADQRRGRAGRLEPGVCYRYWTRAEQHQRPDHSPAEIAISDLAPALLEVARWGVTDLSELHWLDAPPEAHVQQARQLLRDLGALDDQHRITAHGEQLLQLGLHPRLGHMLLHSRQWQLADTACQIAALLEERDPLPRSAGSDLQSRLDALAKKSHSPLIKAIQQRSKQLQQRLNAIKADETDSNATPDAGDQAGLLLALAYPDRIGQNRHDRERRFLLSGGKGAHFAQDDPLALAAFVVVADLDGHHRDARIHRAARLSQSALENHLPELIQSEEVVQWDKDRQRVKAERLTRIGALVLKRQTVAANREHTRRALLDGLRQNGQLPLSPAALSLQQRIECLRHYQSEQPDLPPLKGIDLPRLDNEHLLATLEDWLLPFLGDQNKPEQLQKLDWKALLLSQTNWNTQQAIDRLAPEKIEVPSGSHIRIDYGEHPPVLPVRLQELFGLTQTPAILDGHAPLMIHLLSPARRPVQVTQDLPSFWQNTYPEVRKELRIKYQKHYWPEDPTQAQATRHTKKRMGP